jgi:hypothetical protein
MHSCQYLESVNESRECGNVLKLSFRQRKNSDIEGLELRKILDGIGVPICEAGTFTIRQFSVDQVTSKYYQANSRTCQKCLQLK